ncbi:MAG: hypothetical protein ACK5CO_00165 [Bacteroidota bacterium]
MSKNWKVTLKQQKSVKRGSSSFAVTPGISFKVVTISDSQPQARDIEKPFLNAVNADSVVGTISTSDFKIEKV